MTFSPASATLAAGSAHGTVQLWDVATRQPIGDPLQGQDAPVLSVSLGDEALFRIGGTSRRGPTKSLRLKSGDVLAFGGRARLAYHGIDRVIAGSSALVPGGGRINLGDCQHHARTAGDCPLLRSPRSKRGLSPSPQAVLG